MKLTNWRRSNGWTLAQLGERLEVSEASVSRYERDRIPEPDVMRRIVDLSDGQVTPNDFFGLITSPPPANSDAPDAAAPESSALTKAGGM